MRCNISRVVDSDSERSVRTPCHFDVARGHLVGHLEVNGRILLDIRAGNVARGVAYADSLERYQGAATSEMLAADLSGTLRAMTAEATYRG